MVRLQSVVLVVLVLSAVTGRAATFTWSTGTPTTGFEVGANWVGGVAPGAGSVLDFGPTGQPSIVLGQSIDVDAIIFSGAFPSYSFSATNSSILGIGAQGISMADTGANLIEFQSSLGLALRANQSWTVSGNSSQLSVASAISGTGFSLAKSGSGMLELAGANSYTGGTTINGGTLSVSSLADGGVASSIGASSADSFNLILNGGALSYTGPTVVTNRLFSLGPTGGILDASGTGAIHFNSTGFASFIHSGARTLFLMGTNTDDNRLDLEIGQPNPSEPTSLHKSGSGTWVLGGANAFSGSTTIAGGTLKLANSLALQYSTLNYNNQGGTLGFGSLNGVLIGALSGAQGIVLANGASAPVALTVGGSGASSTYTGVLSGDGSLIKTGFGTLTLGGANTYTGATTISSGILSITHPAGLGSTAGSTMVNNGGTLNLNGVSVGAEAISIAAGGSSGAGALTATGTSSLAGAVTLTANASIGGPGTLTLTGPIGQSGGSYSLSKSGSGTLILEAQSTYTGTTNVNFGTLRIGTVNALSPLSPINLFSGATLDVAFSQSVPRFGSTFGSSIQIGADAILTIAPQEPDFGTRFDGVISGSGGLTIAATGASSVTLAGSNTYSGGTTVSTGTLLLGADSVVSDGTVLSGPAGTGSVTVNSGAALAASFSDAGLANPVFLASNAMLGSERASDTLFLGGAVTLLATPAQVQLASDTFAYFTGSLTGPAETALTFTGGGNAVMAGATSANIVSVTADGAGAIFVSPGSMPEGLSIRAINQGYIGVGMTDPENVATPLTASAVLDRIADPAAFDGTFGFDTDESRKNAAVFREDLDFSAFTHPNFTLGSASGAVVSGMITPPSDSYGFGNGGGTLVVRSNLTGNRGVSVSSTSDRNLVAVLSGNNTFAGNLSIYNSAVILNSPSALPYSLAENNVAVFGSGSIEGRVYRGITLNGIAYIGSTEAFSSARDFLTIIGGHTEPGVLTESLFVVPPQMSIIGLDSQDYILRKVSGDSRLTGRNPVRTVNDGVTLDLGLLAGLGGDTYLGTATSVDILDPIRALYGNEGTLGLLSLDDGRLTISSSLSSANVGSVVVGSNEISDSNNVVHLRVENTYVGGTELRGGTLLLGSGSALGGGNLVINGGGHELPVLAADYPYGLNVYNSIFLQSSLQLGQRKYRDSDDYQAGGFGALFLNGNISTPEFYPPAGLVVAGGFNVLAGQNTYTGGTKVENGILVFASGNSIPSTGLLRTDYSGYIGIGSGLESLGAEFIDRFDKLGTSGTIGFDSIAEGGYQFAGPIDLTGFNSSVRLGSATYGLVDGLITPPTGSNYRFGGGGGSLHVGSALTNRPETPATPRGVFVESPADLPLTLYLDGANTYTGMTTVSHSAVIFSLASLSTPGFPATNNFSLLAGGYIGLELNSATPANDATDITGFVAHFQAGTNRGFVGLDADNPGRQVDAHINLSGLAAGVYLGTTSEDVTISSTSTVTFADGNYRFAGYKGGSLRVASTLVDNGGASSVLIGDPDTPATHTGGGFSGYLGGDNSTVTLAGANTYTGGTDLYAGTLNLGGSGTTSALGAASSPLRVQPNRFSREATRLTVSSGVTTVANDVVLNADLDVGGYYDFTLAGVISGVGELYKVGSNLLELTGANTFSGGIYIADGRVAFGHSMAAGTGPLLFGISESSSATFNVSAVINGIYSDHHSQRINLPAGEGASPITLTINQTFDARYQGYFNGNGAIAFQGPDPATPRRLRLMGDSGYGYFGPVAINPGVTVIAANHHAFGDGVITLSGGQLAVESGVALSNDLVLHSGAIAGTGTFSPAATLSVGPGMALTPGFATPGTLQVDGSNLGFGLLEATPGSVLDLAGGGTYHWRLMDAANEAGGWDSVAVAGSVSINATSITPFNFKISSIAADGGLGLAGNFNSFQNYSWVVLTAQQITGFHPASFNLSDTSSFLNSLDGGYFSLSLDGAGSSLLLNFTPVPEPSTYAMIVLGLGAMALVLRRRRF